jgi:hypothetical protein
MYVCHHLFIFQVLFDILGNISDVVWLSNLHLGLSERFLYYKFGFNVKGIVEHSIQLINKIIINVNF